ncbi:Predicted arabinose efflux permease, MFS family [Chelatococcus sambhunathii]|uniref:Predicted arabinose efflux permease, MFS family n=1 Tax=Chelatococcus sambhunathii TaxID=363953 RepID=A0ABM9U315_9HYPH|nr:MFS transporter [Chelatococcus sambhunathii]CUA87121.1 Predicted arabinose efflux permease, MFS family [Chelatococcus sambhunathii]
MSTAPTGTACLDSVLAPTVRHWLAAGSVGTAAFALVTAEFLPVGLLPAMAADIGISEGQAGLMVTMAGVLGALAAPTVTVGAGRLDRRNVLMVLVGLLVASNLIVALSTSYPLVLLGRLLLGIGVGGFWCIGVAIGPRVMPEPTGTRGTAIIFAGISLGTVAGVPAGTFIGDVLGWRAAFAAAAGIGVAVLVAQALLLPALPPQRAIRWRDLPALLHVPKARIGLLAAFFMFGGQFFAYTYIAPYLVQITGLGSGMVTGLLLAYGTAGFFGNVAGSWVAGKDARTAVAATALVLGASALALAAFGAIPMAAIAIIVVWGLAFGALPIATQTFMFRAASEALETGAALLVSLIQVAIALGATVGGLTVDGLGLVSTMVAGGIVMMLGAPVIAMLGRERRVAAAVPH